MKNVHINMCPIWNGYRVLTALNLEGKLRITENIWNKIINTLSDKLTIQFNFMKETASNLLSAMLRTGFQKSHYLL
jgi:hypothetical protein